MLQDESWCDDPGNGLREEEFPDEPDGPDEPSDTVACPDCGAEVYEDAVQCPRCGSYITHRTTPWSGRPLWWIVLGVLGILAAILGLAGYAAW